MEIRSTSGHRILTREDWASVHDSPGRAHHWKAHRSAWSLAEFVLSRAGDRAIEARVGEALGCRVVLREAVPEQEVRFDAFGRGRVHDLAIHGETETGERLFVGIEAKVDEPFGQTTREVYLNAKAKQITGTRTNAPERIEGLLASHFSAPDASMFDVRYQLLYATAGTLAVSADRHVLFVIVFETPAYDAVRGAENDRDYLEFMAKLGAAPRPQADTGVLAHQLSLGGRELLCLHEHVRL